MDAIPSLFETLQRFVNLSSEDLAILKPWLRQDSFPTGSYVFREGDAYHRVGFIVQGLAKKFYLTSDGKEFIKEFSRERDIIAPLSSLLQRKPAHFSVEVLEPTVLLSI